MWSSLALLICGIIHIHSSPIPNVPFLPCQQHDHVCLIKIANILYNQSVVTGDPSLNIASLEPMYQEEIVGNLATIKYKLLKTTIRGFGQCEIVNTTVYLQKLNFELLCPYFSLVGDYNIDGDILGLAIEGNGGYNLESKDYSININADVKPILGSDGKTYITVKTFKVTADCRGGTHYNLRNLFNGNKELGDNVLKFINQNWKLVTNEMQGPVINANIRKMLKNFNKHIRSIPLDSLLVS